MSDDDFYVVIMKRGNIRYGRLAGLSRSAGRRKGLLATATLALTISRSCGQTSVRSRAQRRHRHDPIGHVVCSIRACMLTAPRPHRRRRYLGGSDLCRCVRPRRQDRISACHGPGEPGSWLHRRTGCGFLLGGARDLARRSHTVPTGLVMAGFTPSRCHNPGWGCHCHLG